MLSIRRCRDGITIVLVAVVCMAQSRESADARSFTVTHYDVDLEPRIESKTISGVVSLSVVTSDATVITLNRGTLAIDAVQEAGRPMPFKVDPSGLHITLPPRSGRGARFVSIRYHGEPPSGLIFAPEREQIYTLFATSQWMPALDDPDHRATLRLRVMVRRGWTVAASGHEVSRQSVSPEMDRAEWRLDWTASASCSRTRRSNICFATWCDGRW